MKNEIKNANDFLISVSNTNRLIVEIANKCNLRCKYCHQRLPNFKVHTMPSDMFLQILDYAIENDIKAIDFTGGGETTLYPNWNSFFDQLLDKGISLGMTSNFSRDFTDAEIKTLSRLSEISISVDTVNEKILKHIRGVDLKVIVANIIRISSLCIKNQRKFPNFIITAVYTAEIVDGLADLVAFTKVMGSNLLNIQELVVFKEIAPEIESVWALEGTQALDAVKATQQAMELADKLGVTCRVQGDFLKRLDELEKKGFCGEAHLESVSNGLVETHSEVPAEGETRDCLDPWEFVQVLGDGQVRACCFREKPIGIIGENTLAEILDGEKVKTLRSQLLSGDLDSNCRICHWRKPVKIASFQCHVEKTLVGKKNKDI